MKTLFGKSKILIGMVHVRALPSSPLNKMSLEEIVSKSVEEALIYKKSGFDAVMIENMHDRPYIAVKADPVVIASMAIIGHEVKRATSMPLGVQILTAANKEALAVALASSSDFIRAEAFTFAHIAHSGFINACAGELVRYRKEIGSNALIFADIKKKHAAHSITSDVDIASQARTAERFLADALIVTGQETGMPASIEDVKVASKSVNIPVLIGSGINYKNIINYLPFADGFIVGSSLKKESFWYNEIDKKAVDKLVEVVKKI